MGRFTTQDSWHNVDYSDPLTLNLYTYCWNNPLQFIDPSGYWPDWGKLAKGALLATVGVLSVVAVAATGGTAAPLVAAGYAALGTAGTVLVVQGTSEVIESFTGENYVKDAVGDDVYYIIQDGAIFVASFGAAIIDYGSYYNTYPDKYYDYNYWAKEGTKNNKYSKVMLGKHNYNGVDYADVAKEKHATFFELKQWDFVELLLGKENMWNINLIFLKNQIALGKEILLSHDPYAATGYFAKEVAYLIEVGYSFIKDGDIWRAIK